jgi:hypothetical protein
MQLYRIQYDLQLQHQQPVEQVTPQQQKQTTQAKPVQFLGLSVVETIAACVSIHQRKKAWKIKTDFNISDRQYYVVAIKTLTNNGQGEKDAKALEELWKEVRGSKALAASVEQILLKKKNEGSK